MVSAAGGSPSSVIEPLTVLVPVAPTALAAAPPPPSGTMDTGGTSERELHAPATTIAASETRIQNVRCRIELLLRGCGYERTGTARCGALPGALQTT